MWFSKQRIYLDYASAPPVLPEAIEAMREAESLVGNPGAIHKEAVAAKESLEDSRERIALLLGCKAREIVFTSGLTDANNLAIVGAARAEVRARRTLHGTHWIVSAIEHDSVLQSFVEVESMGGTVSLVEPNEKGIITPETVARLLRRETVFVSLGWANNEIGVIQPLSKIARAIRDHDARHGSSITFHSDAGQAPLYLPSVVHSLGVDLLSLGANKLYGPHGIGALYVGKNATLASITVGGKQERGLRAGTESVALAAGFAASFEKVARERDTESKRIEKIRDEFAKKLQAKIPDLIVNGDLTHALPHILNVSIPNIQSEYVTLALDAAGIAVSTKSACREGEENRSHVVFALGDANEESSVALAKGERSRNTLRFSLGRETSAGDLARVVEALVRILQMHRGTHR